MANGIGVPVIVQIGVENGHLITGYNMNVGFGQSTNAGALPNDYSYTLARHGMYLMKAWLPCVPPAFRVQFGGNQAAGASVKADTPVATWTMSRDSAAASFNLWRAGVIDGPYTQVNPAPIQAEMTIGDYKEYTHTLSAEAGLSFYKLEVVESDGSSTFYGPTAPIYPSLLYYKLEVIDILGNSTFHGPIEPQAAGTNTPPMAHAGWSYIGKEGSPLALNGAASADADGDPLTYDWDFGDGTTLANGGANPNHIYGDDGVYQVCLTITDSDNASTSDCTAATIANIAPSVAPIQVTPLSPTAGSPVTVTTSFSDPGADDSHSGIWGWGDGDSSVATVDAMAGSVSGSHSYAASGVYTLTLSLSDGDQGTTTVTMPVTVMLVPEESGHFIHLPTVVR